MKAPTSKHLRYQLKKRIEKYGAAEATVDHRGRHRNHTRGRKHPKWSDRMLDDRGYVLVRAGISHPLANANGYVREHLIVWVSAGLPKPVKGKTVIHHKNENRSDNRLENLALLTAKEHGAEHARLRKLKQKRTNQ